MAAIALGLATALCWGLADFLGGIRTRRLTLPLVLVVSQLCGVVAIALVVGAGGLGVPSGPDVAPALVAGVCQVAGIAALYRALAIGTMSVISPISASGAAVLPLVVGVAAGERPGGLQVAGMVGVFAGVALATRSTGGGAAGGSPREALALSAIAALGFGGFYVGMDAAADSTDPLGALLVARLAAAGALAIVLATARPRLGGTAADLPALALIGLLDVAANACFALGTETGLLSVVAVLASLYPVGTVVLARAVLGERLAAVQAAGVAVALGGVALIAAG
jgi:drug/metabolite transporter (DMT)-like permease